MLYILVALAVVTLLLFIYLRVLRGRMEYHLTVNHRDFLKSLKIDGVHKLKNSWMYGEGREAIFTVEINGKRKRYETIFTDKELMSSLKDDQLIVLHEKLVKLKRILYMWTGTWLLLFLAAINT